MGLYDQLSEGVEGPVNAVKSVPILPMVVGVIVLAGIAYAWMNYVNVPITFSFSSGSLKPGDNATVTIVFKNTSGKDLENVQVTVKAIDSTQLVFEPTEFGFDKVAIGQERKKEVKVTAEQGVDKGTYAIEVSATATHFEVRQRASIRVE